MTLERSALVLVPLVRGWAATAMDGAALPRGWAELSGLAVVTAALAAASRLPARRTARIEPAHILRA